MQLIHIKRLIVENNLYIIMLTIEKLAIDPESISRKICDFIRRSVESSGLKGVIIAVSGGIDSAVVLGLAVNALGSDRVKTVTIPERDITPDRDITDVMQLTSQFNVTCDTVDITEIIHNFEKSLPEYANSDQVTKGNLKPRIRMIVSYYYANKLNSMVIGSSNRTEYMTGYFTKYGDGGVDLMPLVSLYKSQIRQLAEYLNLPRNIIEKAPSAGLWPNQTDEGEIGLDYDNLDLILYGREQGLTPRTISKELNLDISKVNAILDRVKRNEHKRHLPLILRLSSASGK